MARGAGTRDAGTKDAGTKDAGGRVGERCPYTYDEPLQAVRTWRPEDVAGLEFVETDYAPLAVAPHLHDAWEFVWCQKGSGVVQCGGAEVRVSPGTLLLFAPGEVHSGESSEGWQARALTVHPDIFEEVVVGLTGQIQPFRWRDSVLPTAFAARFAELCAVFDRSGSALEREEKLLFLIGDIVESLWDDTRPESPEARMVEAAKIYLSFYYARDISMKDLAAKAEMPEAYMVETFQNATGVTPSEYQHLMRLAKARTFLARGESPVRTALYTGFKRTRDLDAAFRRAYKVSVDVYVRGSRG